MRTERVKRRPAFASMRNTETDADLERVVVNGCADFVVGDAVQPSARLRMRSRLETGQKMLAGYGNQDGDG